jgi:hypothetical protein
MQRRKGTSSGWAGAAMGVHQDHIEGRLFVGTSGRDVITFVCLRDGSYGIARNGQIQETWAAEAMDTCLAAFHRMIDRRADPDEPPPPPNGNTAPLPIDNSPGPSTSFPTEA